MFSPQQVTLPDGWVWIQHYDQKSGVLVLVPTPIAKCPIEVVLHEATLLNPGDRVFTSYAQMGGRTHGCTVAGGAHTHSPMV
jgi:hypothetical protein